MPYIFDSLDAVPESVQGAVTGPGYSDITEKIEPQDIPAAPYVYCLFN